jgi:hypothetical protein
MVWSQVALAQSNVHVCVPPLLGIALDRIVLHVALITNYLSPCIPDYTQLRELFVQEYIHSHVPCAYTGVHGACFFCTFAVVAGSATVTSIL